jgi:2-desacetyl-2-hydroxyethyl bacteriochlorophyllide A dehydrogenase
MKSIVYRGPREIVVEDRPLPRIGAGEALIRVSHVGVCGTDLNIYQGAHPRAAAPLIMGHEFAGTIEDGHPSLGKGTPVTVYPLVSCGRCAPCRTGRPHVCEQLRLIGIDSDGGMAEYVKAPVDKVVTLPASLSLRDGAFVEPLAVGVHAVRRSGYKPGDTAVVFGAGPIGFCVASCLRYFGASDVIIVEANPYRLDVARKLGFTTIDATRENVVGTVKELTGGQGSDLAFDCAAHPSVQAHLLDLLRVQGTAVVVGSYKAPPPVDLLKVEFRELTMIGIRVYEPGDYDIAVRILESKSLDLDPLLSEREPEAGPEMFDQLVRGSNNIKVLFKF